MISILVSLKRQLETEFHFDVCRMAFDGDSCFNTLHHAFHLDWIDTLQGNPIRMYFLKFQRVPSLFLIHCI
jgi:hypothetical protein